MGYGDLNQKYTIEKYCTRNEVARSLGTNLIDPIWKEIIEFRRRFGIELPFYDASHVKFGFTYIDPIQGKSLQANERVTQYSGGISKISGNSIARHTFRRSMVINSLKEIAKYNNIDLSDITINNIIEENGVGEEYQLLVRYFNCLSNLKENAYDSIDDSFLARHYAILRGEQELTSFYRDERSESEAAKFLTEKENDQGVRPNLIEGLMNSLIEYINNFDVSIVYRISAIFFMFNYVKPFEEHNMELACLLAKRVLASTSIDTACVYIPLESFINESIFFEDISKEVKKTHDFTYAIIAGSEYINHAFDIAINKISQVHGAGLDEEIKLGSDEKQIKKEFGGDIRVSPFKDAKRPETKDEIIRRREERALQTEEVHLSEKEYKARINDLLETDPMLKKSQAHFYVHHSTPGRYYTIQQFVKFEGSVYETGRTSMDGLAKLGYYRREQIKNKFVYTPITKE